MNVHITGTGSGIPARLVANGELAKTLDTSDEWIVSHTGIRARRIAGPDESTATLATAAARTALARAGVKPEDLGIIVLATSTPDYGAFPSCACLVQRDIGAVNAGAFDLFAACTGFIYALETARSLMLRDPRPALVIGADVMTRIVDWKDRNTCVLFGDGAGAVVLQASDRPGGLRDSILRADGTGSQHLVHEGGCRTPESGPWQKATLQMQGRQVFNFAVKAFDETVRALLAREKLTLDDVRWIVPHQANIRIIEATCERFGFPMEKTMVTVDRYGNTSAASIPIALDEAVELGRITKGQVALLTVFGGGFTWAAAAVRL